MNKAIPAALLMLCAVPSAALAVGPLSQGYSYFGGSYTEFTYDADTIAGEAEPSALIGRLGHFMAENIAFEARYAKALDDDSVEGVDVELDGMHGFYFVGHLPLGHAGSLYGLVGYTSADIIRAGADDASSGEDSESGVSWGVGGEFYLSPTLAINAEYTQYLDETGYDLSALGLGLRIGF